MRLDLDGGEMYIWGASWGWDTVWVEVISLPQNLNGGMFAPKWSWDAIIVTWIKLRCDLNASEMLLEWRWDANIGTLMEVRVDMDGCEIYISWPGCSWYKNGLSWDTHFETQILWGGNGIGLRCNSFDPEGSDMWNGWMWDEYIVTWFGFNVWTCMEVMQYMDGGQTWILGSWCRSGRSVMVVKRIFLYLDVSQMGPGWSWGDAV